MLINVTLATALGVGRRPPERERSAEVVSDKMHALEPELVDHAAQVRGVSGQGVVLVGAFVGSAEARHIGGYHGREPGDSLHQRYPVLASIGVAVHEHDGLARRARPTDRTGERTPFTTTSRV